MPRPSDAKLAHALRDAELEELAQRAEAGEFNDFFSEVHATPKVALMKELSAVHAESIVVRVAVGEFDSGGDEAEEWYATVEGRAARERIEGMS